MEIKFQKGQLIQQLYGDKSHNDLTDTERQNIFSLAPITSGIAGGLAGHSSNDTAQGAIVGKNAVENNDVSTSEKQQKTGLEYREKA